MGETKQNESSVNFAFVHSLASALMICALLSIVDIYGLRPQKLTRLDAAVLTELYLGIVTVHLSVAFALSILFLPGLIRLKSRTTQFMGACLTLSITFGLNLELLSRRPSMVIAFVLAAIFGLLSLKLAWSARWSRSYDFAILSLVGLFTIINATFKLGTNIPQHQSLVFLIWTLGYFSCSQIIEKRRGQWFPNTVSLQNRTKFLLYLLMTFGGTALICIGNDVQNFDPRARFALRMRSIAAGTTLTVLDRISDFDNDGYAGWFGGGDCAIFDKSVSPSANEIAGDGIDNNCMAGDRSPLEIEELRNLIRGSTINDDAISKYSLKSPSKSPIENPIENPVDKHVQNPFQRILLITVDALRYDSALARSWSDIGHRCIEYQQAYSASHATTDTIYALFRGRFASQGIFAKVGSFVMPMQDPVPTLPEILEQAGYNTMGIAFHHRFDPRMKLTRGFSSVWVAEARQEIIENIAAPATLEQAEKWLQSAQSPWFLWVHFYDPHAPYLILPSEVRNTPPRNEFQAYAHEVKRTDEAIHRLLQLLNDEMENTAVILSADHGEAFGEHGTRLHSTTLFNEEIHVPLWLCPPGGTNKKVATPVSTIDIAPTILHWADQKRAPNFLGRRLGPHLRDVPVYSESTIEKAPIQALVYGRYKLIRTLVDDNYALFDLAADPLEQQNLAYTDSPQLEQLKRSLDTMVAMLAEPPQVGH